MKTFLEEVGQPEIKIGGKYINPSDITKIAEELSKVKVGGKLPVKTFSNILEWRWTTKIVRVHLYEEYALVYKRVQSPENYYHPQIWITKSVIPLGTFRDQEIDGSQVVRKAVIQASKKEIEDWSKKINLKQLTKKIKDNLVKYLPRMWFATEKIAIKDLGKERKIIYLPLVGAGVGHTEQERLYQIMFDVRIDEFNILHIIQGNVEGKYHGGSWVLGPSDLIAKFGPWQPEEEIIDAIAEFAGRY